MFFRKTKKMVDIKSLWIEHFQKKKHDYYESSKMDPFEPWDSWAAYTLAQYFLNTAFKIAAGNDTSELIETFLIDTQNVLDRMFSENLFSEAKHEFPRNRGYTYECLGILKLLQGEMINSEVFVNASTDLEDWCIQQNKWEGLEAAVYIKSILLNLFLGNTKHALEMCDSDYDLSAYKAEIGLLKDIAIGKLKSDTETLLKFDSLYDLVRNPLTKSEEIGEWIFIDPMLNITMTMLRCLYGPDYNNLKIEQVSKEMLLEQFLR